ncbi:MAG: hypothetical protein K2H45_00725, partial [Acetatifactor sp.]|nr:hypothetical protein [Acetatifactor sp.]
GTLVEFSELPEAYQQMAMYIQEGFRKYQIEGSYQAYFGDISELGEHMLCDILLVDEAARWGECLSFAYDEEADWYIFNSQFEPIFSKDLSNTEVKGSSLSEILDNYVYEVTIARDTNFAAPIRYTSENGPAERDEYIYYPWDHEDKEQKHGYYLVLKSYSYQDERVDINITIQYPQVRLGDERKEIEEVINEKLRTAFFYDYEYKGEKGTLVPSEYIYTDIDRHYLITREDERYLSMRIYEYNHTRWANHPNEWETGITLDMQTGETLRLEDVVGKDTTPELLLNSGAFHGLWTSEIVDNDDFWIGKLKEDIQDESLSDYDSYFYLTDTGLGLVTFWARYYANLEAEFEDLGVEGF